MCDTGIAVLPQVTETIVAFNATARTLTYQATAGMPGALAANRCRVDIEAEFTTRGIVGRIARTFILARVTRHGRHLLADLRHFAERGTPSPRKLARQHH